MIRLNEVIHPLQDVQPALIRRASVARHVVGLTRLTSSLFHHGASYHAAIVSLMEVSAFRKLVQCVLPTNFSCLVFIPSTLPTCSCDYMWDACVLQAAQFLEPFSSS
ncbi:hypothetical protein AcW1_000608 [Taiwanofungus camphoratus]|nr:hypothetical protein AcW1_000608 [Antrodia cinnamomea]